LLEVDALEDEEGEDRVGTELSFWSKLVDPELTSVSDGDDDLNCSQSPLGLLWKPLGHLGNPIWGTTGSQSPLGLLCVPFGHLAKAWWCCIIVVDDTEKINNIKSVIMYTHTKRNSITMTHILYSFPKNFILDYGSFCWISFS
jgi:hypothetical protein